MRQTIAAVVLFTVLCATTGCSHRQHLRKEASLRESLRALEHHWISRDVCADSITQFSSLRSVTPQSNDQELFAAETA